MSATEIRSFISDFTEALVQLSLDRVVRVDDDSRQFAARFDAVAGSLTWVDTQVLSRAGIDAGHALRDPHPHRTLMHPDFVTVPANWPHVSSYLRISMVSEKVQKILFPNLVRKRRPAVDVDVLLDEAKTLNNYLRLVQVAGLTGDRIIEYAGDLKTHGQGQNDSGRIGAVGATIAVMDAIDEIRPSAIVDTYGTMPLRTRNAPADLVREMVKPGYMVPRALLLSSHRAVVFAADPDVAIVSRIGGGRPYSSAHEAYDEWITLKREPAENRQATMHQAALGEVKTALDVSNVHERLALGSRENREEAHAIRFLMMAVLTTDILDPNRAGRRAMYSRDAERFQHVFNLYFAWGYDGGRLRHPEHWEDFKSELGRWCGL